MVVNQNGPNNNNNNNVLAARDQVVPDNNINVLAAVLAAVANRLP